MSEEDSKTENKIDSIITESNGFIVGETLDDKMGLEVVLKRLIQPEAYVFKDPPRRVVDGEIVGLKKCESYRNPNGDFMFRLRLSEIDDVLPDDIKSGKKVTGEESGVILESADSNGLRIKVKKPNVTLWQRMKGFGLLDFTQAFNNAGDMRARWINSLSEIVKKSKNNDGNSVFYLSDDLLKSMEPAKRAFLLKSLSDNKDVSNSIANYRGINAYGVKSNILKEGVKDIAKIVPAGLNIVFVAPVKFVFNFIKGLPFSKEAFTNVAKDLFNLVKTATGMENFTKNINILTGKKKVLYILSKILTAPTHLIGGAFADRKIFSVLLKRECKSDLENIEKDFKKIKDEYKNLHKDKELSKDKKDEKIKENKKETSATKISKEENKDKSISTKNKQFKNNRVETRNREFRYSRFDDKANLYGGNDRKSSSSIDSETSISKINSVLDNNHKANSVTTIRPLVINRDENSLRNAADVLHKLHFSEADSHSINGSNMSIRQNKQHLLQDKIRR